MSSIIQASRLSAPEAKLSAVFLHGLGGDSRATWSADDGLFWPEWLAEDIDGLAVYSVGYEASPSTWVGTAMPLVDRATNVLAQLDAHDIADRPIAFVCHSLGGLVVKQMLRNANDFGDVTWKQIREQTKAVFFFATPHTGSEVATYMGSLGRILLRPSKAIQDLQANAGPLRDLNLWYRNKAPEFQIETRIFFETQATHGIRIVNEASADLGLPSVVPIPIDGDHLSLCKPRSRADLAYTSVKRGIERLMSGRRLLTLPLQDLLTTQADNCKKRDVKFRATHIVLSLFAVPRSFAKACCDSIAERFADDFIARLERYVARQPEEPAERGYEAVDLAEHPLVMAAIDRAKARQRNVADERDLLLAFLHSDSGTNTWVKKQLGDKFDNLVAFVERQSVASMHMGPTDSRLFD